MRSFAELLRSSPFFETFSDEDTEFLAAQAKLESFAKGSLLVEEGKHAETLYLLVVGRVQLAFDADVAQGREERRVRVRTISEPGRVLGWSAMVEPYHYRASVLALEDTQALAFPRDALENRAESKPDFGMELMRRILWVLGNRLRETRIRLVARRYEEESLAIRALLDQSAPQLSVTSPLRKIPFYLENRLTLSDAFQTLELLQVHGDELERNLAGLCLDILASVKKELTVYQQLQTIYEHVTNAPASSSPAEVRRRCCEDFLELYKHTHYVVKGKENLPEKPGHIFILNHLDNHPENILMGGFRLTLDTHFVSSVLLYGKYGEAPIRVIRKSGPDEYAHQRYYDRLGYIYVYAGHVDEDTESPKLLAEQRRRLFLEAARSYILDGKNVVICPEGTNTATEESPVRFKVGAFRLAAFVRPEPLIVPIAVANFDKKITRATLAAVVHKPFKLSQFVPEPMVDNALFAFVDQYSEKFRGYVREAMELTQSVEPPSLEASPPIVVDPPR